jgi:hypothetical protein
MSATATQLLSSGQFCKLHHDTVPLKNASENISFYTNISKMPKFLSCDTLVPNERRTIYNTTFNPSDPIILVLYSVAVPVVLLSLFGFCHFYFVLYKKYVDTQFHRLSTVNEFLVCLVDSAA